MLKTIKLSRCLTSERNSHFNLDDIKIKKKIILLAVFLIILISLVSFASARWITEGNVAGWVPDSTDESQEAEFKIGDREIKIRGTASIDRNSKIPIINVESGIVDIDNNVYDVKSNGVKSKFVFDQKGNLVEGTQFVVSKTRKYRLNGHDVELAENDIVIYEKERVLIKVSSGTKIKPPEIVDEEGRGAVFSYQTKNEGYLKLPNDNIFQSSEERDGKLYTTTELSYKDSSLYFWGKKAEIKNSNGQREFFIHNPNFNSGYTGDREIYIVFDDNKLNKNKHSLFLGEDKIILISPTQKGAGVFFVEGNRFGVGAGRDNTAAIEARNGIVIVEKGKPGEYGLEIPNIKISGNSVVVLDGRSFYAVAGLKSYFYKPSPLIEGFQYGRYSTDAKISLIDNNGNQLNNFDIYANRKDQYTSVSKNQEFKSPFGYHKTAEGFYVSPSTTFNQLTPEAQDFYGKLSSEKQQELTKIVETGGTAELQQTLDNLIKQDLLARMSPIKASVRIPTGGGSGTIIGLDKEGYPIVLSAGHLGGATRPGYRERIELSDGKKYTAVVIAGIGNYPSGNDVSIMRITTKAPDIPYVSVAPESHVVKPGDPALRIGCPGCGRFKQSKTKIGRAGKTIGATDYIYGGESGGGLFHKGKVIGIVSTDGYYTGTNTIRSFLKKYGYDYLIKITMIFYRDSLVLLNIVTIN